MSVTCVSWRCDNCFRFWHLHLTLGEEQTLLLMGTGGLEPMVALALLLLLCSLLPLFVFLSCFARVLSLVFVLYWAFYYL